MKPYEPERRTQTYRVWFHLTCFPHLKPIPQYLSVDAKNAQQAKERAEQQLRSFFGPYDWQIDEVVEVKKK